MSYTVRTAPLARVIDEAFGTIDRMKAGTMERNDAATISSHLGRVVSAVGTDAKVRLAAAKIIAAEARLVDAEAQKKLEKTPGEAPEPPVSQPAAE